MSDLLIASGIASLLTDAIYYPLDTFKVLKQVRSSSQSPKKIFQVSKFLRLYKGYTIFLSQSIPSGMIYMGVYEKGKLTGKDSFTVKSSIMAAIAAEISIYWFRVPFEVVKTKIQCGNMESRSFANIFATLRSMKFQDFYRGIGLTFVRDGLFSAIELPVWDFTKHYLMNSHEFSQPTASGIAGLISGTLAGFLTTPIDLIKTRIQSQNIAINSSLMYSNDNSFLSHFNNIIKSERPLTKIFSGGLSRSIILGSGGLVFFFIYDLSRSLLKTENKLR